MSIVNIDRLPPAEVKRLQTPAQGSPCGCNECRRERSLARLKADIQAETYDEERGIEGSLNPLLDAIHKPDLAEAERAEFDRLNVGERFDGLS